MMAFKMIRIVFAVMLMLSTVSSYAAYPVFGREDFSHWLDAARIAQASYGTVNELQAQYHRLGYELTIARQIEGYAVSYSLATDDQSKRHILAVRGTSNLRNIAVDAAFVLLPDEVSGVDIHQGFLLSSRDIYQHVRPLIKPGYTIDTIGHSLGGASALILAMMLDNQGFSVGEVITFGQPKVTNLGGSRRFRHLDVTRLVTEKDMVPLVPPVDPVDMLNFSIFWHQGTEVVLHEDNTYSVLRGLDSMLRAADFLDDIPGERHVNNHFMTTYIDYLESKQVSPVEVKYQSDFSVLDWLKGASE